MPVLEKSHLKLTSSALCRAVDDIVVDDVRCIDASRPQSLKSSYTAPRMALLPRISVHFCPSGRIAYFIVKCKHPYAPRAQEVSLVETRECAVAERIGPL